MVLGSRWLHFPSGVEENRPLIVAISPAGFGSSFWNRAKDMRGSTLAAIRLPGRENRLHEPALDTIDDIADVLATAIVETFPSRPLMLLGVCSGAYTALEVGVRIAGRRELAGIVCVEPSVLDTDRDPISTLPAPAFRRAIVTLGIVSPEVARKDELFRLVEPTLRADLLAIERYRYRPLDLQGVKTAAIFGRDRPPGPDRWSAIDRHYPGMTIHVAAHSSAQLATDAQAVFDELALIIPNH